MSRNNAKKDLHFKLEAVTPSETIVRCDVSFLKDNIVQLISLLLAILIIGAFALIPFAGSIIAIVMVILLIAFMAYWFSGRGGIEREFWDFFFLRAKAEIKKVASENEPEAPMTQDSLKMRLEKLKEDLITGKITEQEYRRQKAHIEVDLENLSDQPKDV